MDLPVVVFLLALIALGAASAPDCKELVKPFMPEDPKQVSHLVSLLSLSYLQQWCWSFFKTCKDLFLFYFYVFCASRCLENGFM